MTRTRGISILAGCLVALSMAPSTGCGGDFDPGSRITGLRVMAVQAKDDKTYAHPGEKVELTALWNPTGYDDKGEPNKAQWAWVTCVNPTSSTVLGCFQKIIQDAQKGVRPEFTIGTNKTEYSFNVPDDALSQLPPEARRNALIGVITIVCPGPVGSLLPTTDTSPDARSVPFTCKDYDGNVLGTDGYIAGFKRVFIREKDRNLNPKIAKVTWDGQPWDEAEPFKTLTACDTDGNRYDRCTDADHHDVALVLTDDSFEAGKDEYGIDFNEQVVVEYYATEGLFEHDVRVAKDPHTAYVGRTQSKGKTVTMWFVAHDNRGGVVWASRKVVVK